MHRFVGLGEELFDIPRCLPDPMFVFHKRYTHKALAVFAEPDTGRHSHIGLFDQ